MEKIAFIVERLNHAPFNKNIATMTELDSKSSLELLDLLCEIIGRIDKEMENLMVETTEVRIQRIMQFLQLMKVLMLAY
jgi:Intraflagellar transport 81 calponin homology domain